MSDVKPSKHTVYLRADPTNKNIPRQVNASHYSFVSTKRFENSVLLHLNTSLASELGFNQREIESKGLVDLLTGNSDYHGKSFAMNYGGHQFGHWAGQLGDGRAINIGERSHKGITWQLQLKGAGPTPYSRRGDGYAVLRSSIREHLCSEAMHYLGIPTTRSLSLSLSGERVNRDMFYDGNAALEPGAIVCRVAPSFIRFGNFQIHAAQGEIDLLRELADFTIENYFPTITQTDPSKYLKFFKLVAQQTLQTIMHWQRVGFVHGVMNTDNLSILGLTIDYGPYGWLDDYNITWTPNTTDNQHKRYRYGAQPEIGLWNLWQLANALFSLVEDSTGLEQVLDQYKVNYSSLRLQMMRNKLGLLNNLKEEEALIEQLLNLLESYETDMTIFYRELIKVTPQITASEAFTILKPAFYNPENLPIETIYQWEAWLSQYLNCLNHQSDEIKTRAQVMRQTNPKYVLRNYIAQEVIEKAEEGDYQLLEEVFEMLKKPYDEQPSMQHWYKKRPDWARDKPGASQLSCSS